MVLPEPQRLPEAEFDALVNGALKHSIQAFSKLTGFASDDSCVPAQYLRMVSMMYDQLDARKIPRGGAIGEDFPLETLDIAYAALVGLGVTLPIWLNHKDLWQQLAKDICSRWPDIRRWVLFLYRNVIAKEDIDVDIRYNCKSAVLEFLGLIRDRLLMNWSKSITTDREIMKMICDLWFIETRDARFSSWTSKGNAQRESAVFNSCFLIAYEAGTTIDWDNLLSVFRGEPELIATCSLCHLDHEISHEDELDLHCIAWDLHIVTALALQDNVRLALMRQGTVKAASEILALIVDKKWPSEKQVLAARCVVNAIVLLRTRIEDMDAFPFLIQALQRGLVPSLLKSETLLQFADQPLAEGQAVMLLGDILPGYTVYRSMLHQIALGVDLALAQGLEIKLSRGGELYKAWKRLKEAVDERRRLVRRDVANGHIQTCQNDKCSKTSSISRFKRCAGCLHAYYCSRNCQRYDWKNGKHKQYCKRVHERFVQTRGQMSTVHSKDLKFLDQVILGELKKHRAKLSAQPSKLALVDLSLIGGKADAVLDARGANANPFGTKCGCEMFANARWKRMAEVVREGDKPMVLVRAFITGGMARKIVLQAIPLSVVVEGERRKHHATEKYRFNLIFTCCGEGNGYRGLSAER